MIVTSEYFVGHIERFMDEMKLFPPSGRGFIAASAGADSQALIFCMKQLLKKGRFQELTVLHYNHGTRSENDAEEQLVRDYSSFHSLPFYSEKNETLKNNLSNFEMLARTARYQFFDKKCNKGDCLYTAHHLDDSFEWSLMHGLKASSLRPSLGIPLVNGFLRRPFLCVTRLQLRWLLKKVNIPFLEDPSNNDLSFERNYVRRVVVPRLAERFPRYLKHYAYRANEMASLMNVNMRQPNQSKNESELVSFNDTIGTRGILNFDQNNGRDFINCRQQMIEIIRELSIKDRGALSEQVERLMRASKSAKWGPLLFSGAVRGVLSYGGVGLMSLDTWGCMLKLDDEYVSRIKNSKIKYAEKSISLIDFKKEFMRHVSSSMCSEKNMPFCQYFPFWVISKEKKLLNKVYPTLKKAHPSFPETLNFLISNGYWVRSAMELIKYWEKSSYKTRNLPLVFYRI